MQKHLSIWFRVQKFQASYNANDPFCKKMENDIVEFSNYQIPVTHLVEMRTRNFIILLRYQ